MIVGSREMDIFIIITSASQLLWNINVTNSPGYIPFVINTIPSCFQSWLIFKRNTMGGISGARIDYFSMRWPCWSIFRFLCRVIDHYFAIFLLSLVLSLLLRITISRLMIYLFTIYFNSESFKNQQIYHLRAIYTTI